MQKKQTNKTVPNLTRGKGGGGDLRDKCKNGIKMLRSSEKDTRRAVKI